MSDDRAIIFENLTKVYNKMSSSLDDYYRNIEHNGQNEHHRFYNRVRNLLHHVTAQNFKEILYSLDNAGLDKYNSMVLELAEQFYHRVSDMNNRMTTEKLADERHEYMMHTWPSTRFLPNCDPSQSIFIGDIVANAAEDILGERYVSGENDCDIWLEGLLRLMGVENYSDFFAGPARDYSVTSHIAAALQRGNLSIANRRN